VDPLIYSKNDSACRKQLLFFVVLEIV